MCAFDGHTDPILVLCSDLNTRGHVGSLSVNKKSIPVPWVNNIHREYQLCNLLTNCLFYNILQLLHIHLIIKIHLFKHHTKNIIYIWILNIFTYMYIYHYLCKITKMGTLLFQKQ